MRVLPTIVSLVVLGCTEPASTVSVADAPDEAYEPGETSAADAATDVLDAIDVLDVLDSPPEDVVIDAPLACPGDMALVDSFCMDRFEAPNVAGVKPLAFQTAPEGEAWCNARGKRLCSEREWVRACEGASKQLYPYGKTYKRGTCTDDKTWIAPNWTTLGSYPSAASKAEAARLYQADPSGARPACKSEDNVIDLTGNVAEWVTRSFPNANNYEHVMKGCYWSGCYGGTPPSCGFVNPAHPGTFRTYEAGFRCCRAR